MSEDERELLGIFTKAVQALTIQVESFKYKGQQLGQTLFILDYISRNEGCIMSDIVKELRLTPSTATRQTDQLVDLKLVHRKQSVSDRRKVELSLTTQGKKISRQFLNHRMENIRPILDSLTGQELVILMKFLGSVVERLL